MMERTGMYSKMNIYRKFELFLEKKRRDLNPYLFFKTDHTEML